MLGRKVWLGGWATRAETGPDRLYQAEISDSGKWVGLHPVKFQNVGYPAGVIPGFHVNDPSIIQHPTQPWLVMYYTMLANENATATQMTRRNWVGFATSTDDGVSWTHHNVVIGQDNGSSNSAIRYAGAWAPSAVPVSDDEIRVYYHTGSSNCIDADCIVQGDRLAAQVLFTKFNSTCWQKTDVVEAKLESGAPLRAVNVDVAWRDGKWWLVGNDLTVRNIVLYQSNDGVTWVPYNGTDGVLIRGGAAQLLTPHLNLEGTKNLRIAFAYGIDGQDEKSFHVWTFAESAETK